MHGVCYNTIDRNEYIIIIIMTGVKVLRRAAIGYEKKKVSPTFRKTKMLISRSSSRVRLPMV